MTAATISSNTSDEAPAVGYVAVGDYASSVLNTGQAWWPYVLDEARSQFAKADPRASQALRSALFWLRELPPQYPRPSLGIAPDDTVSVEWHRSGNTLHVLFSGHEAEVYFAAHDGDEFETSLDAGYDKVAAALRTIARS